MLLGDARVHVDRRAAARARRARRRRSRGPTLDARPAGRKRDARNREPCLDRPGGRPYDPPPMRVVPLALRRDPLDVLASLAAEPGAFLLDVPGSGARRSTLLGCAPRAVLARRRRRHVAARSDGVAVPRRSARGDRALRRARHRATPALPFPLGGGVVGYLAYELGRLAGRRTPAPRSTRRCRSPCSRATIRSSSSTVAAAQYALVCSDGGERARAVARAPRRAPSPAWYGAARARAARAPSGHARATAPRSSASSTTSPPATSTR